MKMIEVRPEEPKGTVAPKKKALSAFSLFLKKYKETVGKATLTEMSQRWSQMTEAEKEPYKKEAEEERRKFVSLRRVAK